MAPTALLIFDAGLLLAAASDVRGLRIPNALNAALALGGVALLFAAPPAEAMSRLISFAVVAMITGLLWGRGLLGGGDVKLLAACALWIPWGRELTTFALALGLASLLQGVCTLAWTRLVRQTPAAASARIRLPYGISIATAGVIWSATQLAAS